MRDGCSSLFPVPYSLFPRFRQIFGGFQFQAQAADDAVGVEEMDGIDVGGLQVGADTDDVAFFACFDEALARALAGVGAVIADDFGDAHFLVKVVGGGQVEFGVAEFHGFASMKGRRV